MNKFKILKKQKGGAFKTVGNSRTVGNTNFIPLAFASNTAGYNPNVDTQAQTTQQQLGKLDAQGNKTNTFSTKGNKLNDFLQSARAAYGSAEGDKYGISSFIKDGENYIQAKYKGKDYLIGKTARKQNMEKLPILNRQSSINVPMGNMNKINIPANYSEYYQDDVGQVYSPQDLLTKRDQIQGDLQIFKKVGNNVNKVGLITPTALNTFLKNNTTRLSMREQGQTGMDSRFTDNTKVTIMKRQQGGAVESRRKFEDKTAQHLGFSWVKRKFDFDQPKVKNQDGSESTHRLAAETPDQGKTWFVFPTMDYNEKTKQWENFDDNWKAYEHFKAKNELMPFGSDGDAAIKYSINGLINHVNPKQHLQSKGQLNKFKFQQGGILTILNQKGGVQKEIVSGARVISIPETKKIIKQVYSVNKPTDDDYMKLGQTLVEVFNGQDNRPTEYV